MRAHLFYGEDMTGKNNAAEIAGRFRGLLEPVLKDNGYGLIRAEYVSESGNWFLRGFISRDDGEAVSISDCTLVSRIVSKKLDKDDFIDDEYTLEICSRGFLDDGGEADDDL